MQISVVIPSFNRIQTLVRAIESVLNQHSVVDEIIIVDDGSEDDTVALVSQDYPNIKLIRQTNQGVSAARNTGIRQARFEWIALLDSDDSWLPEKISVIRQAQQQYPEYRLFHSDEIWIRNGVRVNPMKKHGKNGGWIFESCLPLCVISPSAVVLQRSLLHTTGYFDESLPACEDYDLWLRICHAFPVHYIEHALIIKYGGHADQLSRRYWGMDRFRIRSLYALLQQQNLRQNYQSAVLSTLITKLEVLLKGAEKHDNQEVIAEFSPMLEQLQPPVRISECAAC
ncbi:MAG: glycosyltransferase [Gammaproteobacteria bacterium]|nr:glycosyltransferase [Gammaproteobacteria bacterium]MCZ6488161.1 glycosyltransferase [Gammaproteobacteria bacterium]MCZ6578110.1 glycosyltransferase [Gammaproteobacteria bacterium]MCZ6667923.1 glycosyltransferase [Gammaproteobacteria bacterium]MCZ6798659.1 glycosyltransferase [Gammaproteobacteria bacterium]